MVSDHLFVILSKVIAVRHGQHITDQHNILEKNAMQYLDVICFPNVSRLHVFNSLKIQKLTFIKLKRS